MVPGMPGSGWLDELERHVEDEVINTHLVSAAADRLDLPGAAVVATVGGDAGQGAELQRGSRGWG